MLSRAIVAGCLVATIAFVAYTRTLLPGVDLGDTGGFQAAVLWPEMSARQAYPLYYALARPFVSTVAADQPARGLNLFSAAWGAAASGLLTAVVLCVTGSAAGAAVAGLLLAFSYTFWTQAVIAEVYTLHLALAGLCLAALEAWRRRPTTLRLAVFFAVYAISFGNHLSMILLLVPFAAFLLLAAEQPADLLRPRIVVLALAIAAAGAMQYAPQFQIVWTSVDAPEAWRDRLAAFWFDATKSDWRASMVLGVGSARFADRAAMFAFDARQQFGIAGLALAAAGAVALWRISRPWGVLVALAFAINSVFAFTYNVGDPHVFFLPGHYFAAFAAGSAIAWIPAARPRRRAWAALAAFAAIAYAGWRAYDTWPAVDRRQDRRAERLTTRLTAGLDDRSVLLAASLNWQVENALLYETRYRLRQVAWVRLNDVMLHFPLVVRDNHSTGRDVALTADAVPAIVGAFGTLFPIVPDALVQPRPLAAEADRLPRGAPFALAILHPIRGDVIDDEDVNQALAVLTGGRVRERSGEAYEVVIGRSGEPPLFHRSSARPFRERLRVPEGVLDVRLDGWVAQETFRRNGFGHVLLDRRRVLFVERGVSLSSLEPAEPFYQGGIYALKPRFRIPAAGFPELALH